MESTSANKRSRFTAPAAAIALLFVALAAVLTCTALAPAGAVAAQITGGTSSPGSSGKSGAQSGGKSPGTSTGRSRQPAPGKATPPPQPAVAISGAHCVPASNCSTKPLEVSTHGTLLVQGRGLRSGQAVAFPRSWEAHIASNSPSAHLHNTKLGLVVTVPYSAHSGEIAVMLGGGRRTNLYGPIKVVKHALHPPAPKPAPVPAPASVTATTAAGTAFAGQGMWIWYMSASDGGSVASIVAQAKAAGVTTLFIKSSDGSTNYWSQFSKQLVEELHAQGLKVCAWQYVYGSNPAGEAELGARAVANGADCLVIDAESQYEGLYGAAQTYIDTLRAKIGPAYPLGLASFPYVNYHPSFPYSVFLGPGGAQFNAPQMYWHDIGTSVASVFVNTFEQNLIYGRPILPLGQTYGGVSSSRTHRLPLARERLRSGGGLLLGLAGNLLLGVVLAGGPAEHHPHRPPARAHLTAAEKRRQERSGAVAAGAHRRPDPHPADHRDLRIPDGGRRRSRSRPNTASPPPGKRTPPRGDSCWPSPPVAVRTGPAGEAEKDG